VLVLSLIFICAAFPDIYGASLNADRKCGGILQKVLGDCESQLTGPDRKCADFHQCLRVHELGCSLYKDCGNNEEHMKQEVEKSIIKTAEIHNIKCDDHDLSGEVQLDLTCKPQDGQGLVTKRVKRDDEGKKPEGTKPPNRVRPLSPLTTSKGKPENNATSVETTESKPLPHPENANGATTSTTEKTTSEAGVSGGGDEEGEVTTTSTPDDYNHSDPDEEAPSDESDGAPCVVTGRICHLISIILTASFMAPLIL